MNKKITLNTGTFSYLYFKYKDYIFSASIILVCFLLILFIIIPQIQNLSLVLKEENQTREKIRILKNNERFLAQLSPSDIDNKLQSLSDALPPEKDFGGILSGISLAASRANVALQDYSFEVGELSTPSAKVASQPNIPLTLTARGSIDGAKNFIKHLSNIIPLSDVTSVKIEKEVVTLSLVFYFKAFTPVTFIPTFPIQLLSSQDLKTLGQVSSFTNAGNFGRDFETSSPSTDLSSSSAVLIQ